MNAMLNEDSKHAWLEQVARGARGDVLWLIARLQANAAQTVRDPEVDKVCIGRLQALLFTLDRTVDDLDLAKQEREHDNKRKKDDAAFRAQQAAEHSPILSFAEGLAGMQRTTALPMVRPIFLDRPPI